MSYIGREPGVGVAERYIYTATGAIATISSADDGRGINYTVGQVSVYLNGVKQVVGTDVTCTSGNTVVFASNIASGDVVEVIALAIFSPADTVSASSGGSFSGNVSFGDNNITNVGDISLDTISADGSSITINTDTALATGVDIETSTTGKIKQKGSFMQSSTHQSWVLGG